MQNVGGLLVVRAGKAAGVRARLINRSGQFPAPYTPAVPPTATIYDPTGTQVATGPMTAVAGVTGRYIFSYVTNATPTEAQLGIYTATVDALDPDGNPVGSVDAPDELPHTPVFILTGP